MSVTSGKEVYHSAFSNDKAPYISYGITFPEACAKHVKETFKAERVYIMASGSLSKNTSHVKDLEAALEGKVVGVRNGMTPHTLWSELLSVAKEAKEANADLLITLGSGSYTDGAKVVAFALSNNASTPSELDKLHGLDEETFASTVKPPTIPIISIPTSLSGGEFNHGAGATDDRNHRKVLFRGPIAGPRLVILDAALTTTTPDKIWLSTGIRAVDHCVESACSLGATPSSFEAASAGLSALVPGLLRCKANADDLEARHACQMGVVDAIRCVFVEKVLLGASHGIGHQLGPLGVGHGETSCILLPAVCKYNKSVNGEQQAKVCEVLWGEKAVADVLERRGLSRERADLGDVLDAIVTELGLPRRLKPFGVMEDKFDGLAENALYDHCCKTNPIPLKEKEQVLEILKMVA